MLDPLCKISWGLKLTPKQNKTKASEFFLSFGPGPPLTKISGSMLARVICFLVKNQISGNAIGLPRTYLKYCALNYNRLIQRKDTNVWLSSNSFPGHKLRKIMETLLHISVFYFSAKDCEMGEWSAWTECSNPCGKGSKHRKRAIIQERMFGGKRCRGPRRQKSACHGEYGCLQQSVEYSREEILGKWNLHLRM